VALRICGQRILLATFLKMSEAVRGSLGLHEFTHRNGGGMRSTTTDSPVTPSPPPVDSPRPIPTVEQLCEWTSEPDLRVVIRNVDWAFYEQLVDSIPEGIHIHLDYDGKDLEIVSPTSILHDASRVLLGHFVEAVAEELEIPYKSAGQMTWKRPEVLRGLEADECYFFRDEKLSAVDNLRSRKSMKIADYPNPDLAIEVDISRSKVDRPGIYAALKVAEVWRFDGPREVVIIEVLGEDGVYHAAEQSTFLPVLAEEVRRWVVEEDSRDESAWARRLRAWVRAELASRPPG
jgi:Uma2 family endonuclease